MIQQINCISSFEGSQTPAYSVTVGDTCHNANWFGCLKVLYLITLTYVWRTKFKFVPLLGRTEKFEKGEVILSSETSVDNTIWVNTFCVYFPDSLNF